MATFRLNRTGADIGWTEHGTDGPTAVWLPGLGMPALGNFGAVLDDPDLPSFRSILVDLPGSGGSGTGDPAPQSIADHAACVAELLDHLGLSGCLLIGYSMGGSVAIALADQRPDLVSRLIVAEANLRPGGGAASRRVAAVPVDSFVAEVLPDMLAGLATAAADGDRFAAFVAEAWGAADPVGLHASATALVALPDDFMDRFLGLGLPRTFVIGEKNLPVPGQPPAPDAPDPDRLSEVGVSVATLAGVGHDLMITRPGAFARLIAAEVGPGG